MMERDESQPQDSMCNLLAFEMGFAASDLVRCPPASLIVVVAVATLWAGDPAAQWQHGCELDRATRALIGLSINEGTCADESVRNIQAKLSLSHDRL